jgi:hypothetical protein
VGVLVVAGSKVVVDLLGPPLLGAVPCLVAGLMVAAAAAIHKQQDSVEGSQMVGAAAAAAAVGRIHNLGVELEVVCIPAVGWRGAAVVADAYTAEGVAAAAAAAAGPKVRGLAPGEVVGKRLVGRRLAEKDFRRNLA